jgi:hypothetical protein
MSEEMKEYIGTKKVKACKCSAGEAAAALAESSSVEDPCEGCQKAPVDCEGLEKCSTSEVDNESPSDE